MILSLLAACRIVGFQFDPRLKWDDDVGGHVSRRTPGQLVTDPGRPGPVVLSTASPTQQFRSCLRSMRVPKDLISGMQSVALFSCVLWISCSAAQISTTPPVSAGVMSDTNMTFRSSANSNLHEGVYIAAGLPAIAALAAHLASHPGTQVTRLLLSDSTVYDLDTNYGILGSPDDYLLGELVPLADEEEDREEDIRHHNAKVNIRQKRTRRDILEPISHILARAAPSLEALVYLEFICPLHSECGVGNHNQVVSVLDRDFPSLRYFTLRKPSSWGTQNSLGWLSTRAPQLTHLHVRGGFTSLAEIRSTFPRLTHLRLTAPNSIRMLLHEIRPPQPPQGWVEWVVTRVVGTSPRAPAVVPGNMTVLVQPSLDQMYTTGWCGTGRAELAYALRQLDTEPAVYMLLPNEEDHHKYSGGNREFPVGRAMAEFEDGARGGEGEWRVPPVRTGTEDYWWDRKDEAESNPRGTEL
ncbi:hypothetical protein C8J57DRAFT_44283 [Mycena rebaudengoi]|nr:hypothetical protein C8J57DRAFT_44283 [Mycena rebaudengoi]